MVYSHIPGHRHQSIVVKYTLGQYVLHTICQDITIMQLFKDTNVHPTTRSGYRSSELFVAKDTTRGSIYAMLACRLDMTWHDDTTW